MEKIFALVDCNSFYCSCERLFRPDLNERPVGVLSNNDGCFVSRTNELKALGVKMGAPYFQVKEICDKNNVAVFSANFALYTNISDRVMISLSKFAPEVEIYSVDEAFLDLSSFSKWNLDEYAKEIRRSILQNVGIPVSVGIGRTKTLAKVANHIAKKHPKAEGVYSILRHDKLEWALRNTKVEDVWGVGRKSSAKLNALGIKSAMNLRDYKNTNIIQKILTKVGRQTQDELKEISCFPLNLEIEKKKEIMSSRTFGSPVYDLQTLKESVSSFATIACEKLRAQGSVCSKIEVWVRTNPFKDVEQYFAIEASKLQSHTSDTRRVIKESWKLLDKIYRPGFEYKKASIMLSGIIDRSESQMSLLEVGDTSETEILMQTVDKINRREGHSAVKSLACGLDNSGWKMNQKLRSKRYTVGWTELLKIK